MRSEHFREHTNQFLFTMLVLFRQDLILQQLLRFRLQQPESHEILLRLLVVTHTMIHQPSLQIVLTDLRLQLYQLTVTHHAVHVIPNLLVTMRLQKNEPRQVLLFNELNAFFRQTETEVVAAQSKLSLGRNPVSPWIVNLEVQYLLVVTPNFGVLSEVKVNHHQEVVDIRMRRMHRKQGLDTLTKIG